MKIPSEPNETEQTGFVRAALHEAARYEPDTVAPNDLVTGALARHAGSGRRCGQTRLVPGLAALALGMAFLANVLLWPRTPQGRSGGDPGPVSSTAPIPGKKVAVPEMSASARLDIVQTILPPIDLSLFAVPAGPLRHRHRLARHNTHLRPHTYTAPIQPSPVGMAAANSMWSTETVHREVITRTITPVWVAHTNPDTATIVLTPALFQLALQPDDIADTTASPVAATLIPVRFEQENNQP